MIFALGNRPAVYNTTSTHSLFLKEQIPGGTYDGPARFKVLRSLLCNKKHVFLYCFLTKKSLNFVIYRNRHRIKLDISTIASKNSSVF